MWGDVWGPSGGYRRTHMRTARITFVLYKHNPESSSSYNTLVHTRSALQCPNAPCSGILLLPLYTQTNTHMCPAIFLPSQQLYLGHRHLLPTSPPPVPHPITSA